MSRTLGSGIFFVIIIASEPGSLLAAPSRHGSKATAIMRDRDVGPDFRWHDPRIPHSLHNRQHENLSVIDFGAISVVGIILLAVSFAVMLLANLAIFQ